VRFAGDEFFLVSWCEAVGMRGRRLLGRRLYRSGQQFLVIGSWKAINFSRGENYNKNKFHKMFNYRLIDSYKVYKR
jgi:hypothetical protein